MPARRSLRPAPAREVARVGEGYRTFDHTGDLGLEVWAESPERLFALAAEGLLAQVATPASAEPEARARVELTGDDPRDLLVHWLNTALLRAELDRAIWTRVQVHALDARTLSATLEGPRLNPSRDVLRREVKAVSHHDLALALEPGSCRCRLVLDL